MTKQTIPYPYLDTPVCLLDLNKLESNIKLMQQAASDAGVKLRPHTKVHESAFIAKIQLEEGASGIEVGAIDQAEPMAEAGISDIFIVHPFFGEHKLNTLKQLLCRWPKFKFTVVVDMIEQAEGISKVAQAVGKTVPLVIKLDTGVDRYGVLPGEPTLGLAKKLQQVPGIELIGLYAHESGARSTEESVAEMAFDVASKTCEMARALKKEGFKMEHVSVGASSTHFITCRYIKEGKFSEITELHPGQRAIGDIRCMMGLGITREQCALTVLVSIMSTSHPNYVVIDAGWKTFGSESMIERREMPEFFWNGKPNYGYIQGRSDTRFARIAAETGWIYYMEGAKKDLKIGDRLKIIPNNTSCVINIHNKIYGIRKNDIEVVIPITGRCLGS
jgi:D-serine deaminase-like pyridoxal phosphate-dependent protein